MRKDIILSGVGGQGILTIATIIGEAATAEGINLKQAEVHGMSQRGGDVQSPYDCYRRFVQMFADVVMMVPKSLFEVEIDKMKEAKALRTTWT